MMLAAVVGIVAFVAGAVVATLFHSGLRTRYVKAQRKLGALEAELVAGRDRVEAALHAKLLWILGR